MIGGGQTEGKAQAAAAEKDEGTETLGNFPFYSKNEESSGFAFAGVGLHKDNELGSEGLGPEAGQSEAGEGFIVGLNNQHVGQPVLGPEQPHVAQQPGFDKDKWIVDCGATDTMTHDKKDFISESNPIRKSVQSANGGISLVEGGGTICVSPSITLRNYLYVPSLSCKLLSVSHVSKELNCVVLMYTGFCIFQELHSRKVIGCDTERGGLYYVDDVVQQGNAALSHGIVNEQQWLWHRRLGHPSLGYLKLLFPSLFSKFDSFHCETCLLAKSHRQTFRPSNTRVKILFQIVHTDVWRPAPSSGTNHNVSSFKYFILFIDDCTRMT